MFTHIIPVRDFLLVIPPHAVWPVLMIFSLVPKSLEEEGEERGWYIWVVHVLLIIQISGDHTIVVGYLYIIIITYYMHMHIHSLKYTHVHIQTQSLVLQCSLILIPKVYNVTYTPQIRVNSFRPVFPSEMSNQIFISVHVCGHKKQLQWLRIQNCPPSLNVSNKMKIHYSS